MSRLLVIDDERQIREILADVLEAEGYEVDQAANGSEALQRIRKNRPQAILLDLMMPVMDGWTFARTCHGLHGCDDIPIVVLSAAADLSNAARDLEPFGVRAVLAKPFDLGTILSLVSHLTANGGHRQFAS